MKFQLRYDGFCTSYCELLFLCLSYGLDFCQPVRVAPSPIAETQLDFLTLNFWVVVLAGNVERMGLLFFNRLALSSIAIPRRKEYPLELYRFPSRKTDRLVAHCRTGGSIYYRIGLIGIGLFALG